jgi:hypothetical protein
VCTSLSADYDESGLPSLSADESGLPSLSADESDAQAQAVDSLLPSIGCMRNRGMSTGSTSSSSSTKRLFAAQVMMRTVEAEKRRREAEKRRREARHHGSGVGKLQQQQPHQQQQQRMGAGAPQPLTQPDLPMTQALQLAQQARTSDSRHSRQHCARVLSAFRAWTAPATATPRAPPTGTSDPWLDLPPGMLVWK